MTETLDRTSAADSPKQTESKSLRARMFEGMFHDIDNPPLDSVAMFDMRQRYIEELESRQPGQSEFSVRANFLMENVPVFEISESLSPEEQSEQLRTRRYASRLLQVDDRTFMTLINNIYRNDETTPGLVRLPQDMAQELHDEFWTDQNLWELFQKMNWSDDHKQKWMNEAVPAYLAQKGVTNPEEAATVDDESARRDVQDKWDEANHILRMSPYAFELYMRRAYPGSSAVDSQVEPDIEPVIVPQFEEGADSPAADTAAVGSGVDSSATTSTADSVNHSAIKANVTSGRLFDAPQPQFGTPDGTPGHMPWAPQAPEVNPSANTLFGTPDGTTGRMPYTGQAPSQSGRLFDGRQLFGRAGTIFANGDSQAHINRIDTRTIDGRIDELTVDLEDMRADLARLSAKRQGRLYVGSKLKAEYDALSATYEQRLAELNIAKAERLLQVAPETPRVEVSKMMIDATLEDDTQFREKAVANLQKTKFSKFVNFLTSGSVAKRIVKQVAVGAPVTAVIAGLGIVTAGAAPVMVAAAAGGAVGLRGGLAALKLYAKKDAQLGRGFATDVRTDECKAELQQTIEDLQLSDGSVTPTQLARIGRAITSRTMTHRENDTKHETGKRRRSAAAGLGGAAVGAVVGGTVAHIFTSGITLGQTLDQRAGVPYTTSPSTPDTPPVPPVPTPEIAFSPDAFTIEQGEGIRQTILEATGARNISEAQFDAIMRDVANGLQDRTYAMGADSWGWNAPGQLSQADLQLLVDSAKAHGVRI